MCNCVCLADICVNAHAFQNIIGGHGQYLAFNRDGVKELNHFLLGIINMKTGLLDGDLEIPLFLIVMDLL